MRRLEYTESAEADLVGIIQTTIETTIETWGTDQATRYIDGLERVTGHLLEHPALGAIREDLVDRPRAFPYQSHVLYYRDEPERLVVLRVLHKRMDAHVHMPLSQSDPNQSPQV
ncbi:MAG: type II toxin-antitoxin system RelE/ParE family toxin [Parahaliea sp.]